MSCPRPTWLVTGGSGFLGRHLLDRLESEPVDVVALGRHPLDRRGAIRFVEGDLLDQRGLTVSLSWVVPDVVFHLAGKTPPADPEALDRSNRLATVVLVDALASLARPIRLIVAGSAAELGPVPVEELPVAESRPCRPDGDYGRSKLAATEVALAAPASITAIVARVFNPIGPGLPTSQALGRFASLIARGAERFSVGELSPRRDFIDARDAADAFVALARRGKGGIYHLGTGESRSIAEGLEALIRLSGRAVMIEPDPSRSGGPSDSRADIGRIRAETGWSPRIPFERSVADLWASASAGRD
jgi:nucleoside-diphosphate-sugar epimerase